LSRLQSALFLHKIEQFYSGNLTKSFFPWCFCGFKLHPLTACLPRIFSDVKIFDACTVHNVAATQKIFLPNDFQPCV